jgi:hypothetical protein
MNLRAASAWRSEVMRREQVWVAIGAQRQPCWPRGRLTELDEDRLPRQSRDRDRCLHPSIQSILHRAIRIPARCADLPAQVSGAMPWQSPADVWTRPGRGVAAVDSQPMLPNPSDPEAQGKPRAGNSSATCGACLNRRSWSVPFASESGTGRNIHTLERGAFTLGRKWPQFRLTTCRFATGWVDVSTHVFV